MSSVVVQPALQIARRQRWFWFGSAVFAAMVVFVGFSPTFYLKPLFAMPGELSALRIVHGTVFSAWIALFVAQTWLVATDRRDVHRTLGAFGAVLVAAMCVAGYRMAIDSGRRGFTPDPQHVSALSFMVVPLFDLGVFVLLVAAVTLPNARLVGFDVKVPTEAAVPLPDRLTLVGEFVALLTNLMLPLAVPEAEGANFAE